MHGKLEPYVHVKGIPWLSLDKALVLRVCWAAPYFAYDDDGYDPECALLAQLKRGKWAGHCFDVVRASDLETDENWQDVTKDIIREAKAWEPMVSVG